MERKRAGRWFGDELQEGYVNLGPGRAVLKADPTTHMVSKANPAHTADSRMQRFRRNRPAPQNR